MEKLSPAKVVLYASGAVMSFLLAYSLPGFNPLTVAYLFCLLQLSRAPSARQVFYGGMVTGAFCVSPQLFFFWGIFGAPALILWMVLGFWIGLFVALARSCRLLLGPWWLAALSPFLWTGIEYFRSELYYLRFSWMNIGYVFSGVLPAGVFHFFGMYGLGFLAMGLAAAISAPRRRVVRFAALAGVTGAVWLGLVCFGPTPTGVAAASAGHGVRVAGVQLEFPTEDEVLKALDGLARTAPDAELLVLSEYTFLDKIPARVKRWCREHHRYLIVGGEDSAPRSNFYNTAFVIDPQGEVVFRQVKSVPIQMFKDGLPAPEQKVWASPWGRIGICICYDLSYTRVADTLIRQGAQALVVPTMDVADWGRHQHELHARVAPVRSAEYGVPIFRVASSGFSQLVDRDGRVTARAGFPGQRESITGWLDIGASGSLPLDRWLAPCCTGLAGVILVWALVRQGRWKAKALPGGKKV